MKNIILLIFCILFCLQLKARSPEEKITSLVGEYKAIQPCSYTHAYIRSNVTHPKLENPMRIEIKGTHAFDYAYFMVQNLEETISYKNGLEYLKTKTSYKKKVLKSETQGCFSDTSICGPWNLDLKVRIISRNKIEISKFEEYSGCTFERI